MGWDLRTGLDAATGGDHRRDRRRRPEPGRGRAAHVPAHARDRAPTSGKGVRTNRADGLYRAVVSGGYNLLFMLLFGTWSLWDINGKPKGLTRTRLRADDADVRRLVHRRRDRPHGEAPGAADRGAAGRLPREPTARVLRARRRRSGSSSGTWPGTGCAVARDARHRPRHRRRRRSRPARWSGRCAPAAGRRGRSSTGGRVPEADEQVRGALEDAGRRCEAAAAGADAVLHLAAVTHSRSPRSLPGHQRRRDAAAARGGAEAGVSRFVLVSTRAIDRGRRRVQRIEGSGGGARPSERARRGRSCGCRRCTGRAAREGVDDVIARAARGGRVPLVGRGDDVLCPAHVDDVAAACAAALDSPAAAGRTYTLAGECLTVREFAVTVAALAGRRSRGSSSCPCPPSRSLAAAVARPPAAALSRPARSGCAPRSRRRPRRRRLELGFRPRPLRDGLAALVGRASRPRARGGPGRRRTVPVQSTSRRRRHRRDDLGPTGRELQAVPDDRGLAAGLDARGRTVRERERDLAHGPVARRELRREDDARGSRGRVDEHEPDGGRRGGAAARVVAAPHLLEALAVGEPNRVERGRPGGVDRLASVLRDELLRGTAGGRGGRTARRPR